MEQKHVPRIFIHFGVGLEGHPDKVADQISDSVLDAILAEDPKGRVACETLVSTGLVVISGEITTKAHINYREIAQEAVRRIGYDNSEIGFDYKSCAVLAAINRQSPDIAQGSMKAKASTSIRAPATRA